MALPTTKQVELINNKKFAKMALNENVKAFIVHMTCLLTMGIYMARKAQIALLLS